MRWARERDMGEAVGMGGTWAKDAGEVGGTQVRWAGGGQGLGDTGEVGGTCHLPGSSYLHARAA